MNKPNSQNGKGSAELGSWPEPKPIERKHSSGRIEGILEKIRFSVVFFIGFGLISFGFFLELSLPLISNFTHKFTEPASVNGSVLQSNDSASMSAHKDSTASSAKVDGSKAYEAEASKVNVEHSGSTHKMSVWDLLVLLFKELGVAFIVASIVGSVLERAARERDLQRSEKLRKDVATDAIFALFGLFHDSEFIKAVIESNLMVTVVRTDLKQTYSLRELTPAESTQINGNAPEDAMKRFVMLDMRQEYKFKNVSTKIQNHPISLGVSRRTSAGASALTKATFVKLGDEKPLSSAQILEGTNTSLTTETQLMYTWYRDLDPNESIAVMANICCIKERSDNEVWASFHPTMGEVELNLEVLPGMNFDLREVTNASKRELDVMPTEGKLKKSWALKGPLLRHNSAVFWWRTKADEGLPNGNSSEEDIPHPVAVKRATRKSKSSVLKGEQR